MAEADLINREIKTPLGTKVKVETVPTGTIKYKPIGPLWWTKWVGSIYGGIQHLFNGGMGGGIQTWDIHNFKILIYGNIVGDMVLYICVSVW